MMTVVLPIVPGAHRSASTRLQAEDSERRREPERDLRDTHAERQTRVQDRPLATPSNPLQIGRSDLDPFINNPNPLAPSMRIPGSQGDGMFVGPDHPIFGGTFGPGRGQRSPSGQTPWGGGRVSPAARRSSRCTFRPHWALRSRPAWPSRSWTCPAAQRGARLRRLPSTWL